MDKNKFYRWYSLCSAHAEYEKTCDTCNIGSWIFIPSDYISKFLFFISPALWRIWSNRGNSVNRFKQGFTDRDGNPKNPFPNM